MWIVSIALLLHELLRFSRAAISSQQLALCCADTDYSKTNFLYCANGKDFSSAPISSCASCVSYQCIDWTFGSAANTVREATFFQETNEKVYFGVGSYSSANTDPGGLCYRITTSSLDRDLIVQIVNSGGDVSNGNVDLQTGDGGFGYYDACTQEDTKMPQFSGTATAWGVRSKTSMLQFFCPFHDTIFFHRIGMVEYLPAQNAVIFHRIPFVERPRRIA